MTSTEKLRELAASLLAGSELELWDIEVSSDVVRILVDRSGGIDLDALTRASGALSTLLDNHPDAAPGTRYVLEVSSPGIERNLRTPEHYLRYVGSLVSVKTFAAVEGARRWRGTLVAVNDEEIALRAEERSLDDDAVSIRFEQIERSRTVLVGVPPRAVVGAKKRKTKQTGEPARRTDPRTTPEASRTTVGSGADVKDTP